MEAKSKYVRVIMGRLCFYYSQAYRAVCLLLVAMGVTNRGGCASSRSSGSPLVLGNQKLRKEALLVGCKSQYLYTLEIKPIPSHPAFGRSLFVYTLQLVAESGFCKPLFRLQLGFVYQYRSGSVYWFRGI